VLGSFVSVPTLEPSYPARVLILPGIPDLAVAVRRGEANPPTRQSILTKETSSRDVYGVRV